MRETTPEMRAKALADGEEMRRHAQEGLESVRRLTPEDMALSHGRRNLSREERALYRERRELYIERLETVIAVANARMEFLEPLIEVDQERAALEASREAMVPQMEEEEANPQAQEEGDEYNGFDWTEVEEAVERESAELESTQVYKNRVSSSRQAWATMERRSSPVTPTGARIHGAERESSAPRSMAGNEAAPQPASRAMVENGVETQPVPRAMAENGVETRPVAGVSDSRARYPENPSSVRDESETPQTETPISSTRSNTSRSKSPSEAPNFWQRYMPEELGGWSKEKVADWDRRHPKEVTNAHTQSAHENREVFKGVTVRELREAGYSNEQIQRMDNMVSQAQNRSGGLIATLGMAAQETLTREDYQQAGLNNQDMATIYKLSQNDR